MGVISAGCLASSRFLIYWFIVYRARLYELGLSWITVCAAYHCTMLRMRKLIFSVFLLGILFCVNAQVPTYVPTDSLKGWWGFNGNANNESGSGNNLTNYGATLTKDRFGNAASAYFFNGSNYMDIAKPTFTLNPNNSHTYSAWVKVKSYSKILWNSVITSGGVESGYFVSSLSFAPTGQKVVYGLNVAQQGWSELPHSTNYDTNYIHLVAVYNTGNMLLYVNGSLVNTMIYNRGGTSANMPFRIGADHSNNQKINGIIDDVGVWNRALTAIEINNLYYGCALAISNEPDSQTININQQAQISISTNDNSATYQWQTDLGTGFQNLSNAGQYSGTQNDTLVVNNVTMANNNQDFRCIVKSGSCADTSKIASLKVVDNASVDNLNSGNIQVYPNPSSFQVVIDNGNYSTMGTYAARIVNAMGQEVFKSVINKQQFTIDATAIGGTGVYTLYIIDAGSKLVGTKKIVLQ